MRDPNFFGDSALSKILAKHVSFGGSMSSSINQGILVTVICEAVLQHRIVQLLDTVGASGYTIIPAQGAGSYGQRMGDIEGFNTNIQVKTIVSLEASDQILEDLQQYRESHALIAFRQQVDGLFD